MIFKLIIIFMLSNGEVGTHISGITSFKHCIASAKNAPALAQSRGFKLIAAVHIPPQNIRIMPSVQT